MATALIADYYTGPARESSACRPPLCPPVVFLSVGGFLADINWRMPFFIYLVAWFLSPAVLLLLPEPSRTGPEVTSQANLEQPLSLPRSSRVNLRHCAINPDCI